jgi:hypothetical protein
MQSAETVLGVLRERGRRGLPCDELYRQLFNPQLYLLAYGRIYSNKGAMTPGATGDKRTRNAEYERLRHASARARKKGEHEKARELRRKQARLPSVDCDDPGYRRLRYTRYADDVLLGFAGPKAEAEEIKQRLTQFMRNDLRLELSDEKTLITHARTGAATFLGYEITTQTGIGGRRSLNGTIALRVPSSVIKSSCVPYLARGAPAAQRALLNLDDYDIVAAYGAQYRGIVQYYLHAGDVHRLDRLHWVMETSLLKTLAAKHHSTVSKTAARYKAKIETPHGLRTCFEAVRRRKDNPRPLVARFGGVPLTRRKTAVIDDRVPGRTPWPAKRSSPGSCGTGANSATPAVRCTCTTSLNWLTSHTPALASRRGTNSWQPGDARPLWSARPATITSTQGGHQPQHSRHRSLESRMPGNRHVRFGGGPHGKGPANMRAPRRAAYPTVSIDSLGGAFRGAAQPCPTRGPGVLRISRATSAIRCSQEG